MFSTLDADTVAKILAPVLTLIGWFVKSALQARPKLEVFVLSSSDHPLQGVPLYASKDEKAEAITDLRSHSVLVRNTGKRAAMNVRIQHGATPPSVHVLPIGANVTRTASGPGFELLFPVLVPGEHVHISYLYRAPMLARQIHGLVKCDEMLAKTYQNVPTAPPSKPTRVAGATLALIGATAVLYALVRAYLWLLTT